MGNIFTHWYKSAKAGLLSAKESRHDNLSFKVEYGERDQGEQIASVKSL